MHRIGIPIVLSTALLIGCAARIEPRAVTQGTLAELHDVQPDVQEVEVEQGLEQAMEHYRRFLEETPETAMTPDAMRRLADLQIEKQFGIRAGDGEPREMAAPELAQAAAGAQADISSPNIAGPAPNMSAAKTAPIDSNV